MSGYYLVGKSHVLLLLMPSFVKLHMKLALNLQGQPAPTAGVDVLLPGHVTGGNSSSTSTYMLASVRPLQERKRKKKKLRERGDTP